RSGGVSGGVSGGFTRRSGRVLVIGDGTRRGGAGLDGVRPGDGTGLGGSVRLGGTGLGRVKFGGTRLGSTGLGGRVRFGSTRRGNVRLGRCRFVFRRRRHGGHRGVDFGHRRAQLRQRGAAAPQIGHAHVRFAEHVVFDFGV